MAYTVTLIPGDGIGPDVTTAAVRVLEATGIQFNWEIRQAGIPALEQQGELLPNIFRLHRSKVFEHAWTAPPGLDKIC